MGLMGSLYVGASGLQTSQNAMNTTAHNVSNIDTIGYTRQQVQQGTRFYNTISKNKTAISWQQIGLGVNYTNVKQVRDVFLDKTYRREVGRSSYYDTSLAAIEEVEDLFQELQGKTYSKTLENLRDSLEELTKHPSDSVRQGVLIQRCYEFVTRSQAVYTGLSEYQDDLNLKIEKQIKTINEYGKQIRDLNEMIQKIESGQVEKANDYRDQRNLLLDELSAMGDVRILEDGAGNMIVQFEGYDFIREDGINKIELYEDPVTGFYTPYWSNLAKKTTNPDGSETLVSIQGAEVFNLQQEISAEGNTDIGSLKAMLFARGDHRATYRDLGDGTTQGNAHYNNNISQSIVMNVQAQFDRLVNAIVVGINGVLKDAADAATALDPNSTYLRDSNGDAYQIFNSITGEKDAQGNLIYTTQNLIINGELKQAPSLLGFIRPDGKEDQATADRLRDLFKEEKYVLNPNVQTKNNFIDFYSGLIAQVTNTGYVLHGISANQRITVDNTAAAREQILGVSSDEELSNMIMFQNAYNASSRYINVVDELLEHVISTLGR